MIAYVFWHWPDPEIGPQSYQEALLRFHRTLAAHKPEGFHFSRCLLAEHASWLARDAPTYEDWSIVENTAALDPLNTGAVTGACLEPHQNVAQWTIGSAAGLYSLRAGKAALSTLRFEYRFSKPAGLAYTDLATLLDPLIAQSNSTLWTRMLNLGPGPEFCLQSAAALDLPAALAALTIPVQQLF